MKTILTLTDFSPVAESAVETAFRLASLSKTTLHIYHGIDQGEIVMLELDDTPEIVNHDSQHLSPHRRWMHLAEEHGVEATYAVGSGHLPTTVDGLSRKLGADLVVMGTTGRSQHDQKYWGSNAENLVKQVNLPILTTSGPGVHPPFKRVVFASSFDTTEQTVLQEALAMMPLADNAVIHLLSIDTLSVFAQPSIMMKNVMKDFQELCLPYESEQHFYPDYSVDAGIRHFVDDYQPDLVIMSHHQDRSIKHWFRGNSTLKTINHSDCPILIMRG